MPRAEEAKRRGRPPNPNKTIWKQVQLQEQVVRRIDELRKPYNKSRGQFLTDLLNGMIDPLKTEAPMEEEEFRQCLEASVRQGGIGAMKLWSEIYRDAEPPEVVDPFDEARDEKLRVVHGDAA